jgi:uncharacterized repeat protein (TIGR03803 family)
MAAIAVLLSLNATYAKKLSVLYAFHGGSDGMNPSGGLIRDQSGNLYGTTSFGGGGVAPQCGAGCGTVFKIAPDTTETVLYAFTGGSDGSSPSGKLNLGSKGILYGTAQLGGFISADCSLGCGTVWKLTKGGAFSVRHTFEQTNSNDGYNPTGGMLEAPGGIYYGTTQLGGGHSGCSTTCGTLYKIAKNGTESLVYVFGDQIGSGGAVPLSPPVIDSTGNLYGATSQGGGGNNYGNIYKITPGGIESQLFAFHGTDGSYPSSQLLMDSDGNLFGEAEDGGNKACFGGLYGCGTVFKLAPNGTFTVLYTFTGGVDGGRPIGGLSMDYNGNLYGATTTGGDANCNCGVVFKVAPNGVESVLHAFTGGNDGAKPAGGLLKGKGNDHYLYGTTANGGDSSCNAPYGCGTVFKVKMH